MISIIITSFKEPLTIGKAIESFIKQKIKEEYELIVVCPDEPTIKIIKRYARKYSRLKHILDEGKGKSAAINKVLKLAKGRIIILTDGDVYVSEKSIDKIIEAFEDEKVGCVTGQPVSINPRDNIFGYWSHLLCYTANKVRLNRAKKGKFLECSGYLWAFRNKVIKKFPKDASEDTIVPILFFLKGWKIAYEPEAKVYIKFPTNFHDFVEQKKRNAKGHEILYKHFGNKKIPRMKTFKNEILGGWLPLFFTKHLEEVLWTLLLYPLRLYIWVLVFYHIKIKKQEYKDAWERIESTK